MASTFTAIPLSDMDAFLVGQGFERIDIPGTVEYVYGKRVDKDGLQLTLRVLTTISLFAGNKARKLGSDSIKVQVWWRKIENEEPVLKMLSQATPVKRTNTWQSNLQKRLDAWQTTLGPKCRCCGFPMVEKTRKADKSSFYGCSNYPTCRNTCPK
jgi:hypothetical protein